VFFRTQNLSLGTFSFFFGLRGFGCLCFFVAGGFSFFLSDLRWQASSLEKVCCIIILIAVIVTRILLNFFYKYVGTALFFQCVVCVCLHCASICDTMQPANPKPLNKVFGCLGGGGLNCGVCLGESLNVLEGFATRRLVGSYDKRSLALAPR
jgi:hypothetical protein